MEHKTTRMNLAALHTLTICQNNAVINQGNDPWLCEIKLFYTDIDGIKKELIFDSFTRHDSIDKSYIEVDLRPMNTRRINNG